MFASAELQKCEPKDQSAGPEAQQRNHGERPEITEKSFAASLRVDVTGQSRPRPPCVAIEPACDAELPPHSAWEDYGLEGIEQDRQRNTDTDDNGKSSHRDEMKYAGNGSRFTFGSA